MPRRGGRRSLWWAIACNGAVHILVLGGIPSTISTQMNSFLKLGSIAVSALVLLACSKEGPNADRVQTSTKSDASAQTQANFADSIFTVPLEQKVQTDPAVAVSNQEVDYTKAKTWITANSDKGPSALEFDILRKLQAVNAAVNKAYVASVTNTWSADGGFQYIVLVYGTTPNTPHTDKFTNLAHAADLYGVFMTNRAFTRATRRIGMFVSPRTGDYTAWLVRRSDSAVVCGNGSTYGDQRARWAFVIDVRTAVEDSLRRAREASEEESAEGDYFSTPPNPDCPWVEAKH